MAHSPARVIYDINYSTGRETPLDLATVHSATQEAVDLVLAADPDAAEDGRSQWLWLRLRNGDLMLGVFPQGDTYFEVELDAETPAGLDAKDYPVLTTATYLAALDAVARL